MSEPSAAHAPDSDSVPARDERIVAAPLVRRMAAFMYEGVLCLGVVVGAYIPYWALNQPPGPRFHDGLVAWLFVILGIYFVSLWARAGQTLALKTWHLRVTTAKGQPISARRAVCRYLAAWIWFVPPLAVAEYFWPGQGARDFGVLVLWIVLYALSALLHPSRQFWHDWLCDTAIVTARAVAPLPQ